MLPLFWCCCFVRIGAGYITTIDVLLMFVVDVVFYLALIVDIVGNGVFLVMFFLVVVFLLYCCLGVVCACSGVLVVLLSWCCL